MSGVDRWTSIIPPGNEDILPFCQIKSGRIIKELHQDGSVFRVRSFPMKTATQGSNRACSVSTIFFSVLFLSLVTVQYQSVRTLFPGESPYHGHRGRRLLCVLVLGCVRILPPGQ